MKGFACFAALALSVFFAHAAEVPQPEPAAGKQKESLKLVRDLFADAYALAEKDPAKAGELGRTLALQAAQTKDDPAGRFVLYQESARLLAEGGALSDLEGTLAAFGAAFEYDVSEFAEPLLKKSAEAAVKLGDMERQKAAEASLNRWKDRRPRYKAALAARKKLRADPKDAAAHQDLGLYLCMDERNWAEGLPHLALSADPDLKALGEQDLAAQKDAGQRALAGDLWHAYAAKQDAASARHAAAQERCVAWYEQSLAAASGLTKVKIEKRLAEMKAAESARVIATLPPADLDLGLVGRWAFDEAQGDRAEDTSGQKNHGQIKGKYTWTEGKVGGCLNMLGESCSIEVKDAPSLNPATAITLAAWVNCEYWWHQYHHSNRRVFWKGGRDIAQYDLWGSGQFNAARLRFDLPKVGGVAIPLPPLKEWHHIAATYDGQVMILYIDGKEQTRAAAKGPLQTSNEPLYIGARLPGDHSSVNYVGMMDDPRIYNRALSAAEVQALAALTSSLPKGLANLPEHISTGAPMRANLLDGTVKGSIELLSGPPGLTISPQGEAAWTPALSQVGTYPVRIKATLNGAAREVQLRIKVTPAGLEKVFGAKAAEVLKAGAMAFHGTKVFVIVKQPMSWSAARAWAEAHGGTLASIQNGEVNALLHDELKKNGIDGGEVYLGASDAQKDGEWRWLDGTPFGFSRWRGGEPNGREGETVLSFLPEDGTWNDASGERNWPFIAQWQLFTCKRNEKLPETVAAGQTIEGLLLTEPSGAKVELVREEATPKGLAVAPDGRLTWKTADADAGRHVLTFQVTKDELSSRVQYTFTVVSKEVAAKVGGDLSKIGEIGRLVLVQPPFVDYTLDRNGLLVFDSKTIYVLDPDGQLVLEKVKVEKDYLRVAARPAAFVALSAESLDILDRKTGKLLRSIDLKAAKTFDLAAEPGQAVSWVAMLEPGLPPEERLLGYRVVRVDETTGAIRKPDELHGNMVKVHPNGKLLFTALKEVLGGFVPINGTRGPIALIDNTEHVDLLISYDLANGAARLKQVNKAPGANGKMLCLSPDGRYVSYVAGGGYRSGQEKMNGYTIPAFPVEDLRMAKAAYDTGPNPSYVAFHPQLPLVACYVGGFYDRETGQKLTVPKVDLLDETKFDDVTCFIFSPNGKNFLASYKDGKDRRVLRAFPLILNAEERAKLNVKTPVFTPAGPADPAVAQGTVNLGDLEAMGARPGGQALDAKEIAKAFKGAVVVVESKEGSGTGFFIGSKGYVLTCAHVLPENGEFNCKYLIVKNGGTMTMTARKSEIVAIDRDLDLALVKAEILDPVPTVLFAKDKPEMGQKVTIIGNPGKGQQVFDYTLTTGVVSNAARDLDGTAFLQTDASVNPGSSGSPIFDEKGNVAGMVVLKAKLERIGLGIPVERIRAFVANAGKK